MDALRCTRCADWMTAVCIHVCALCRRSVASLDDMARHRIGSHTNARSTHTLTNTLDKTTYLLRTMRNNNPRINGHSWKWNLFYFTFCSALPSFIFIAAPANVHNVIRTKMIETAHSRWQGRSHLKWGLRKKRKKIRDENNNKTFTRGESTYAHTHTFHFAALSIGIKRMKKRAAERNHSWNSIMYQTDHVTSRIGTCDVRRVWRKRGEKLTKNTI